MSVVRHTRLHEPIAEGLLSRWRAIPVAVVVDKAAECQVDPAIRPLLPPGQQPPLFGRAVTARCTPPDFGAVLVALDLIGAGDVLVIDAGGTTGTGMIGEILGGHLHRLGAAGIVCDGPVRDVGHLAKMPGLSVYARSVNPRGPTGLSVGDVNVPVVIGGCAVSPGDLVIGDDDGLAIVSPAAAVRLIEPAEAKLRLEAEWTARLAAGERFEAIFSVPVGDA